MSLTKTLAIIKPGAVKRGFATTALGLIDHFGIFRILGQRFSQFSTGEADLFYQEHKGKSFYDGLVRHTASGPCIVLILEGPDAVARWRDLIGGSDPKKAFPGTVRASYLSHYPNANIEMPDNAVHGSDSNEAAAREIDFVMQFGLI